MRDYQRELEELRQRIAQRREHIAVLENLRRQEVFWQQETERRQNQWKKEERDVEQLERVSLSSVWASIRGSKEDDLDREKAEAWAARLKLQEAERQLEEIRMEISDREARVQADADCERQYEELLLEKERELRKKDPVLAAKLAEIEQRQLTLASQLRELQEAGDAGERALAQIDAAQSSLRDAEGWSTWDLVGGGLLTDMMKYSRMDEAQRLMEGVQSELRRYQAELADVAQAASFEMQPDGMLRMADYFFDNFFTDFLVRDRIQKSVCRMQEVGGQVAQMQEQLRRETEETRQKLAELEKEREAAVRQA